MPQQREEGEVREGWRLVLRSVGLVAIASPSLNLHAGSWVRPAWRSVRISQAAALSPSDTREEPALNFAFEPVKLLKGLAGGGARVTGSCSAGFMSNRPPRWPNLDWQRVRQTEVAVSRRSRSFGLSKWNY